MYEVSSNRHVPGCVEYQDGDIAGTCDSKGVWISWDRRCFSVAEHTEWLGIWEVAGH